MAALIGFGVPALLIVILTGGRLGYQPRQETEKIAAPSLPATRSGATNVGSGRMHLALSYDVTAERDPQLRNVERSAMSWKLSDEGINV